MTTTPQEPSPETTDEPILNDREQVEALQAEAEPAEAEPAEPDDRA